MLVYRLLLSAGLMMSPLLQSGVRAEESKVHNAVPITNICQMISAEAGSLLPLEDTKIEYLPDGCILHDITYDAGSYQAWHAETVTIKAAPFDDEGGSWPAWGEISIENVLFAPRDMPGFLYMAKMQRNYFDLKLAYQWDAAQHELKFTEARFSGPKIGDLKLQAVLKVPDLPQLNILSAMDFPFETMQISAISMRLDDQGMFVNYVLSALIGFIGFDKDPAPEIENYRNMAQAMIAAMPQTSMAPEAKQALRQLISDLPHPAGIANLEMKFEPPLVVGSSEQTPLSMLAAFQERVKFTAHYPAE